MQCNALQADAGLQELGSCRRKQATMQRLAAALPYPFHAMDRHPHMRSRTWLVDEIGVRPSVLTNEEKGNCRRSSVRSLEGTNERRGSGRGGNLS